MEALQSTADLPPAPLHVAIIMDGNGRWAKSRGLPRSAGHKRGAETVREVVKAAPDLGIGYLTLFGFSTENWKRPQSEVRDLMALMRLYLRSEINGLHKNGVRLLVVGDRSRLAPDLVDLIEAGEKKTAANTKLTLTIAVNYGGRQELIAAARKVAEDVRAGRLSPDEVDEQCVNDRLFTTKLPDPDLLIRTSGEMRISNFLLWQCAYSELLFVDVLWPDFSRQDLEFAVHDYRSRDRRYGTVA